MNARRSLLAPNRCPVPAILLGSRVLGVEDLTRPWASGVRTSLVTLEDGRRVVHQEGAPTVAGRRGIARRIRFARALGSAAPALPVPAVLGGDARANPPFAVTSYIAGESGDALLATPAGAARLSRLAGGAAMALATVPSAALGRSLPRTWADPGRLATAAARWLREAAPLLHPAEVESVSAVLDRIPGLLAAPPVVAHGDLAPVNLLVAGARLAGILDLERLRLAPAAFDAAWFRLLVHHHHPERWPDAGPPLLAVLGLPDDEATADTLDDLAVLACLEMVAALPRPSPDRVAWAARARERLAVSR
jgi:aminoglycoside phosphotransferase (APT) family kinase protein